MSTGFAATAANTSSQSANSSRILPQLHDFIVAVQLDTSDNHLRKHFARMLQGLRIFDEGLRRSKKNEYTAIATQTCAELENLLEALEQTFEQSDNGEHLMTLIELTHHSEQLFAEVSHRVAPLPRS